MLGAPLLMRRTLGAAIRIERPVNSILNEAVPEDGAAVIEDDGVGLAFGRTQYPADHLAIEPHLLRRSRQDAATDLRHIPAFGEHHAVGNEFDLAGCQSRERRVALGFGVEPSMCSARTPDLTNSSRMWTECADADRKGHGLSTFAELMPVRDDIADQLRLIHALGKLLLDVIAGLRCGRPKIGIDWRIGARTNQVALLDQFLDLRALDHRPRKWIQARVRRRGMVWPSCQARPRSDRPQ